MLSRVNTERLGFGTKTSASTVAPAETTAAAVKGFEYAGVDPLADWGATISRPSLVGFFVAIS